MYFTGTIPLSAFLSDAKRMHFQVNSFIPPYIPDSHPHRITSTKCHINTVVSPDDGHTVAQNIYIYIYIYTKK